MRRKIGQHRATCRDSRIPELEVFGGAPRVQEPAYDDAAIEEIREGRSRFPSQLERKSAQPRVPRSASQKSRRAQASLQVSRFRCPLMEEQQSADCIAGNLSGYGRILAEVRSIISRDASAGVLDSRLQKPAASRINKGLGRYQKRYCNIRAPGARALHWM